jgi:flavin reductase (DIM6/NTAB) family NADH-FMN oxidoreductase RutF
MVIALNDICGQILLFLVMDHQAYLCARAQNGRANMNIPNSHLDDSNAGDLHPCEPARYRDVMGAFATGVTVMTLGHADGFRLGVTASSFNTVSVDPPLILWSLALKAPSLTEFRSHDLFAVNVLAADQKDCALQFARPSDDKFAGIPVVAGIHGLPLIAGAIAHIECRTVARYPGGDHEIMLGQVLTLRRAHQPPLVFQSGAFHTLSRA